MQIRTQDHFLLRGLGPLETSSEIDITLDGSKSVTATFEEQIFNLVNQDNVFIGTGRWENKKTKNWQIGKW